MKKVMVLKRILAIVSAVGMFLSPVSAMQVHAEVVFNTHGARYIEESSDPAGNVGIYIMNRATGEISVAYCLEHDKAFPNTGLNYTTKYHLGGELGPQSEQTAETRRRKLLAIMHYGFGGDDASLAAGLNDNRLYWAATQLAIWTVTNPNYILPTLETLAMEKVSEYDDLNAVREDAEGSDENKKAAAEAFLAQWEIAKSVFESLKAQMFSAETAKDYVLFEYDADPGQSKVHQKLGNYAKKTTPVKISKKDITSKTNLGGAKLQLELFDATTGTYVVPDGWSWDSANENPKTIDVVKGSVYKLTEVTAPDYYGIIGNPSITFVVDETGSIILQGTFENVPGGTSADQGSFFAAGNELTVYNELVSRDVFFSKRAMGQTAELEGATMIVKKADGTVVDTWVSGGNEHKLILEEGDYVYIEDAAPLGYEKAESMKFRVTNDLKLEVCDPETDQYVPAYNAPVIMYDRLLPNVEFSKTALTGGPELPGAELEVKQTDGDFYEAWTSTEEVHIIKNMPKGEYTLTEKTAPKGYEVAETISFKITEDENRNFIVQQLIDNEWKTVDRIHMEDAPSPEVVVKFNKKDGKSGAFVPGAKMRVVEGTHANRDAAMKAPVAIDKNGNEVKWTSESTPKEITLVAFRNATEPPDELYYTFVEETAPDTHQLTSEVVNFRLLRKSENGEWTAKMQVLVNGSYVDAGELTLTNLPIVTDPGTTPPTPTPPTPTPPTPTTPTPSTPTPSTPVYVTTPVATTNNTPQVAGAVRGQNAVGQVLGATRVAGSPNTGDGAPITLLLVVMGACVACAVVCYIRWAQTVKSYANKRRVRRTVKSRRRR